ncbi:MAG: site-specific DNA-methyltransferase [bacterium]
MNPDQEDQLALPGFESTAGIEGNGNGSKNGKSEDVSAEMEVPEELAIELHTRTFYKGKQHKGRWHDTVFAGDNMHVLESMPDETVDLILTDPPYNINYRSNRRVKKAKFKHIENDNHGDWIPEFAREAYRVLKDNRHLYCFCRHDTYPEFIKALQDTGFKIKRTLIWVKNNHGSGDLKGDYAPQDEWIIYCHKGRRELFGKRHSNVLVFSRLNSDKLLHSTEKPVELLKFLIEKSTKKGELVLDPFAGSGSTMHAAKELERFYCIVELSDAYYLTSEMRRGELDQITLEDQLYKDL